MEGWAIALPAASVGMAVYSLIATGRGAKGDTGRTGRFLLVLLLARVRFRAGTAPEVPGVGMRVSAWLMPGAAGRDWLAEAWSVMFEAAPDARRSIERSYLLAAGQVLVMAWAAALMGQLRARRTGPSGGRGR